ncbi:hypothetical protein GPECTOR_1g678 [Gonium pectorale]|uniref:Uncharacterized protein n=1 Tax=Gonium pectorale TaxID=33097 RepID=A0A150H3X4_GONPE|nr:hypothetical protein GPECTOR_1g678 [Gonium pectorale]|eukprot:KXZ56752.1 hypothetical protein GPECTOR_1g678 [Gonium pectorale]
MTAPHKRLAAYVSLLSIALIASNQLASACNWEAASGNRGQATWLLQNCVADLPGGSLLADNSTLSNRDPGRWLPAGLRPPAAPAGLPLLLRNVTLRLPSCGPLWELAAAECTFRLSSTWPVSGLQAGPSFLYYPRLAGATATAERLNLTCPPRDWAALLKAPPSATEEQFAGPVRLAPCGTASVGSGEELLAAVAALQPGHTRLLVTITANISLPTKPTPQRLDPCPDDAQPLITVYRNVTLAGGYGPGTGAAARSVNHGCGGGEDDNGAGDIGDVYGNSDPETPGGGGGAVRVASDPTVVQGGCTELDLGMRRNAFGLAAGWELLQQQRQRQRQRRGRLRGSGQGHEREQPGRLAYWRGRPVLVLSDLTLVNGAPGPPSSWPMGLLSVTHSFLGMDRYASYWGLRMRSLDPGERVSAHWLRNLSEPASFITDTEGHKALSGTLRDYFISFNYTITSTPLLTPAIPADFNLWSARLAGMRLLQPPPEGAAVGGYALQLATAGPTANGPVFLPPSSFAVANSSAQLLALLQEPWPDGPRVILLLSNISLLPGQWPPGGAALRYNVSLVGPVTGPTVWLDDSAGLGLVQPAARAPRGPVNGSSASGTSSTAPVVVVVLERLFIVTDAVSPLFMGVNSGRILAGAEASVRELGPSAQESDAWRAWRSSK